MIDRDYKPSSIAQVNKALKEQGKAERLYRGKGYFYFSDGDASRWGSTSVMVYYVSALTIGEWLDQLEVFRKENE